MEEFSIEGHLWMKGRAPQSPKEGVRYPHSFECVHCKKAYFLDYVSSMDPRDLSILTGNAQMIADREHFRGHITETLPISVRLGGKSLD
jgi:hypothetical protein